jgi:hypothetical protein
MAIVHRYQLPRLIEIGVTESLDLIVTDEDGTALTPDAGATVTIYDGAEALVTAGDVTEGSTSTYSFASTLTTSRSPSDGYLEVWSATVDNTAQMFQREGYIVRRAYHPTITDTDLTDRHTELANIRTKRGIDSFAKYRNEANVEVQMALLGQGRRPWLIFDRSAARRAHLFMALHLIFEDESSVIGDGRYRELSKSYLARYEYTIEKMNFRYDSDETGTISESSRESAGTNLIITAGPRRRWR